MYIWENKQNEKLLMKNKFRLLLFVILLQSTLTVNSQNYNALSWKEATAYNSFLMRSVHQQYAERKTEFENALKSKKSILEYKEDCNLRYKDILGELPDKSDLKARVTEINKLNGLRIENIVFESIPGRYVTCNLYIPDGNGPFPASLELCGHGLNGKVPLSNSALQMAANGIAVLVVDPVGQGERLQIIDDNGNALTRGVTTEHTLINAGCNLVGTSLAAIEMWDNHRAVDYLLTRKDISHDKIGVYGSSGGGTQAAYLIGFDNRLKVAAICSFFSQRERVLELPGPSDGCQHIPYEGLSRIEIADFALMIAPKPILILSGKYDFVDLWGAQQGFLEIKKTYTMLGVPDKADMLIVETGHGLGTEKLKYLLKWFKNELSDDNSEVKMVERVSLEKQKLLITKKGQVNLEYPDALSIPDNNTALYNAFSNNRIDFLKQNYNVIRSKVIDLLGVKNLESSIVTTSTGTIQGRDCEMYKYQILRVGEMPVPCVVIIPHVVKATSQVIVYLNEIGKEVFLNSYERTAPFISESSIVVAADLRGFGETLDLPANNDPKYWNKEYRYSMVSMHIGKPIMGQRVVDLISILDFISSQPELKDKQIKIIADGIYGPVVIHTAFIDKRIYSAELTRSLKSFKDYINNPMQRDMYSNVLYGVLKYYDLSDLIKKTGTQLIYKD